MQGEKQPRSLADYINQEIDDRKLSKKAKKLLGRAERMLEQYGNAVTQQADTTTVETPNAHIGDAKVRLSGQYPRYSIFTNLQRFQINGYREGARAEIATDIRHTPIDDRTFDISSPRGEEPETEIQQGLRQLKRIKQAFKAQGIKPRK